jgi:hypothetical protein
LTAASPIKRARARLRADHGQAAVELLGLLPVAALVGLALFCALAAGQASEQAAGAAQAGAMALLQDRDPVAAAHAAAPDVGTRDITVRIRDRVVRVTVRPRLPLPGLARRLSATATAHAGPPPEA